MDAAGPSTPRAARRRGANPLSLAAARLVRAFGWSRSLLLRSDVFRAVQLRPRAVMLLRLLEHVVMRRRLVFVIVRFAIIFAHRIIPKLVPHQNASQIGMSFETNTGEIENLALLKFCAAPDGRERWQARAARAVRRPHSTHDRTVFVGHRVKVINRFEITGDFLFGRLI